MYYKCTVCSHKHLNLALENLPGGVLTMFQLAKKMIILTVYWSTMLVGRSTMTRPAKSAYRCLDKQPA
jgi:hypothetical protein